MSRECARVRALQQSERLRHVLQSYDRIELMGYAITKAAAPVELAAGEPPDTRDDVGSLATEGIAAHHAARELPDG